MTLFPTILTLWNTQVHVSITNCGDKASNVESPVDKALCFYTVLSIPNVNRDNGHV